MWGMRALSFTAMPTYEYKCTKCGTEFEVVKKITAKPGSKCPKCGSKAEPQLSGGAGLVFKGSGFYLTDYGRAGQKKAEAEPHAGEKAGKPEPPVKSEKAAKQETHAAKPNSKKDR